MTIKDLLKGDLKNLDPNIILIEDKVPSPNGTNTAMINQNSYIKKIMNKSFSENKQNEEFVY